MDSPQIEYNEDYFFNSKSNELNGSFDVDPTEISNIFQRVNTTQNPEVTPHSRTVLENQYFSISKDYSKQEKKLKNQERNVRIKQKAEKRKQFLQNKRNDEKEKEEENKQLSKKEIKMIRNRLSAQKSRDKHKMEMTQLIEENLLYKSKIDYYEKLINDCPRCLKCVKGESQDYIDINVSDSRCLCDVNSNSNNLNSTCPNHPSSESLNTHSYWSDDTFSSFGYGGQITRKTFSVIGMLGVLCIIGTLAIISTSNNQGRSSITRGLTALHDSSNSNFPLKIEEYPSKTEYGNAAKNLNFPLSLPDYSWLSLHSAPPANSTSSEASSNESSLSQTQIISILNNKYPIYKSSITTDEQHYFMLRREEFLLNLINKISGETKTLPKSSWRANSYINNNNDYCIKANNVEYTQENFNNDKLNTLPAWLQNQNYLNPINKRVESIFCRDYLSTNNLTMHNKVNFEEILDKNKNENDDCYYLHMIFPYENEVNQSSSPIIQGAESNFTRAQTSFVEKGYYEVGCKIFEVNKIIQ